MFHSVIGPLAVHYRPIKDACADFKATAKELARIDLLLLAFYGFCRGTLRDVSPSRQPQALVHLVNERFPEVSHIFDVFKIERENTVMWRGTAETFEQAKEQVRRFAQTSPGVYIILNQRTGERTTVEPELDTCK